MRLRREFMKIKFQALIAPVLVLVLWPVTGFGLGSRISNQDAEAVARGNAFVATADNPSAIYYNPAGIRQLEGVNLRTGSYLVTVESTYHSPAGTESSTKDKYSMVL